GSGARGAAARAVGRRPARARGGTPHPPPRPALHLIAGGPRGGNHAPPLRQEDILDRPVEAARGAQAGHIPRALDDLGLRALEDSPPVDRGAVRAAARLVAVEYLEAAQHPSAFLTAGAAGPATGDP